MEGGLEPNCEAPLYLGKQFRLCLIGEEDLWEFLKERVLP